VGAKLMEFMTVKDVVEGLKETQTVLVPMGVTEQHGYHLPLCTDTFVGYEKCKVAAERTGVFVTTPFHCGYSGGTLPGTINLSPQTVSLMVADTVESLAKQGFRTIIIVPGHGDGIFLQMLELGARMALWLRNLPPDALVAVAPITSDGSLGEEVPVDHLDCHAGFYETSVMMHLRGEWVRPDKPTDSPEFMQKLFAGKVGIFQEEKPVDDPAVVPRVSQREEFRVGVLGDPTKASAEWGERLFNAMVDELVTLVKRLHAGQR
jgi:creatinine amidohydrolase